MANVRGPLFSLAAKGSLAKILTFKKGTRGTVARKYAKPSGQPSAAQLLIRQQTGDLMKNWKTLSIEDQTTWFLLALYLNMEPVNAYLKTNYELIAQGRPTTNTYPPPPPEPPGLTDYVTVEAGPTQPNPDLSGTFTHQGDHNYQPLFQRDDPYAAYLYYDGLWNITTELMDGKDNEYFSSESFEGTYNGDGLFTGQLVVTYHE